MLNVMLKLTVFVFEGKCLLIWSEKLVSTDDQLNTDVEQLSKHQQPSALCGFLPGSLISLVYLLATLTF